MSKSDFDRFASTLGDNIVKVDVTIAVDVDALRQFEEWAEPRGEDDEELAYLFINKEVGAMWVQVGHRVSGDEPKNDRHPIAVWDIDGWERIEKAEDSDA